MLSSRNDESLEKIKNIYKEKMKNVRGYEIDTVKYSQIYTYRSYNLQDLPKE